MFLSVVPKLYTDTTAFQNIRVTSLPTVVFVLSLPIAETLGRSIGVKVRINTLLFLNGKVAGTTGHTTARETYRRNDFILETAAFFPHNPRIFFQQPGFFLRNARVVWDVVLKFFSDRMRLQRCRLSRRMKSQVRGDLLSQPLGGHNLTFGLTKSILSKLIFP